MLEVDFSRDKTSLRWSRKKIGTTSGAISNASRGTTSVATSKNEEPNPGTTSVATSRNEEPNPGTTSVATSSEELIRGTTSVATSSEELIRGTTSVAISSATPTWLRASEDTSKNPTSEIGFLNYVTSDKLAVPRKTEVRAFAVSKFLNRWKWNNSTFQNITGTDYQPIKP